MTERNVVKPVGMVSRHIEGCALSEFIKNGVLGEALQSRERPLDKDKKCMPLSMGRRGGNVQAPLTTVYPPCTPVQRVWRFSLFCLYRE
jgi:hypothetical protein